MTDSALVRDAVADSCATFDTDFFTTPRRGSISKEHGLTLLARLAQDAGFRSLFERSPVQALLEIGVSAATIAELDPECRSPRALAPAATLEQARTRLAADLDHSVLSFIIPSVRFPR